MLGLVSADVPVTHWLTLTINKLLTPPVHVIDAFAASAESVILLYSLPVRRYMLLPCLGLSQVGIVSEWMNGADHTRF